jgi:hypothetical protein
MNWDAVGAIAELLGSLAVFATLVYLAVQVRHSKTLLERNERIALSQVHQARADTRVNVHLSQLSVPNFPKLYSIWGNPEAIEELSDDERIQAIAMMRASIVMQDNALYQDSLGLLDADTLKAAQSVVVTNYQVWEKLSLDLSSRIEQCYEQCKDSNVGA